jgi:hypothetical protein
MAQADALERLGRLAEAIGAEVEGVVVREVL